MDLSQDLVSSLIADLYESAASPAHWQAFLRRVCQLSNSSKAYFLLVDPEERCNLSLQIGWDESFAEIYAREWFKHDLVLESFVAAQQRAGGDWIGDRESVLDDHAYMSSTIYNDLIRRQGDRHLCAAALGAMPDGLQGGFAMRRPTGSRPYETEVVTLLTVLAPHMKRALGLHRMLTGLRETNAVLASSVEAFDIPVLSIDATGKVIHASPAATALLAQSQGLRIVDGMLTASVRAQHEVLHSLIQGAVSTSSGDPFRHTILQTTVHAPQASSSASSTPSFGGAVRITRRPPAAPLQVVVMPFRSAEVLLEDRPAALVFLSDPERAPRPRNEIVRALYRLTPVEARLADCLLAGMEVKAAAQSLRLTDSTARYYLKEIFRKTGAHNQSALIRLLLTLPAQG